MDTTRNPNIRNRPRPWAKLTRWQKMLAILACGRYIYDEDPKWR